MDELEMVFCYQNCSAKRRASDKGLPVRIRLVVEFSKLKIEFDTNYSPKY